MKIGTSEMASRYPTARQIHLLEDRIDEQRREIQTLLHDNQRLAAAHVVLKQDVAAAQDDLRRVAAAAAALKADRDAQVREIYERSLESEAEARSVGGLPDELGRVRADIEELRAERAELSEKLQEIDGEIDRARLKLRPAPDLKSEIEAVQRDIQRGKAAIEHERKMHSTNFELGEAMEKHLYSAARELEILRSEIPIAEKRAMAAVAAAVSAANATAANAGPGFDFIRY